MEYSLHKKLINNTSAPLLIHRGLEIVDTFQIKNKNNKNMIQDLKMKLLPLKLSTNERLLEKNFIFNNMIKKFKTRNKNNKFQSNSANLVLSRETLENSEKIIMNKYFYPDIEKSHEKSKQLNENININNILTHYSKQKYNNEIKEVKKIVQKQKKNNILTNDYSNININLSSLFSSKGKKSHIIKSQKINQLDSKFSKIANKKCCKNSFNNSITIDIYRKIYQNPFHSFNTIKKNQIICNSVIDDYNYKCINRFRKLGNLLGSSLNNKPNSSQKLKIFPSILKFHEKILPFIKKQEKLLLKITNLYPENNSPESRSQFILVKEGNDIILHGGYNICRKHNLWKFNPKEKSWQSIEPIGIKNDLRYAHSGVLYHRNLYIFGGKYFKGINLADIEIFNLDKKCWIFPEFELGNRIPLRRNHVSCGVGNIMFVHGGMNFENQYLDDMHMFDYKHLKWNDVAINNRYIKIPPLAHHCCCLVAPETIVLDPDFDIYSSPEFKEKAKKNKIKEKGIYIFGGKISSSGPINNNIYVIKIGIKPFDIIQLITSGIPPCPRYDSSINFYEKGNMLIIHGGRNNNKECENGLNDTFILDLYQLNWIQVEYYNEKYIARPRYFHQSIEFEGNLYIFGGIEGNNFIGCELEVIDLNSNERCLREKFMLENLKKKMEEDENKNNLQIRRNLFDH